MPLSLRPELCFLHPLLRLVPPPPSPQPSSALLVSQESFEWLHSMGFIEDASGTLTARGRACAAFSDGQPLIIGTIISDEWCAARSEEGKREFERRKGEG